MNEDERGKMSLGRTPVDSALAKISGAVGSHAFTRAQALHELESACADPEKLSVLAQIQPVCVN